MLGIKVTTLGIGLLYFCLALACKVDRREAIFVATEVGRAIRDSIKNCSPLLPSIKNFATPGLATETFCDFIDKCSEGNTTRALTRDNSDVKDTQKKVQSIDPCVRKNMWDYWDCAVPYVTSVQVAKHATAYALKTIG